MVAVALIDQRDQWAGVQEHAADQSPNPSMYLGLVDSSPGPSAHPTKSPANSSAEMGPAGSERCLPFRNCSSAARTTPHLLCLRYRPAPSTFARSPPVT